MRAAVRESGSFVVREVLDPEPGPDQLLLQVAACGICGSDLKARGWMADGTIMGHEYAGTVVAAGADVAGAWPVGTPATALPVLGCGRCADCGVGDPARCAQGAAIGVGGAPGGFAELVVVSAAEAVALPPGLDPVLGALVEPLAVGLHAVNRARVAPGDRVLVVGAGPVGLAVALWAARAGAVEVVVSDPSAARRELAGALGATTVVDPTATELGAAYDVAVECVGIPGMLGTVLDALASRGRGVVAGVCADPDPVSPLAGVVKDVELHFVSYYRRAEFAAAARLLGAGRLPEAERMVSRRVGLEDLEEAVTRLEASAEDAKVLVVP